MYNDIGCQLSLMDRDNSSFSNTELRDFLKLQYKYDIPTEFRFPELKNKIRLTSYHNGS